MFMIGLLPVFCRMEISRYVSDVTALLVGGCVLSMVSGIGVLLEMYLKLLKK